jgi:hypothetical protein
MYSVRHPPPVQLLLLAVSEQPVEALTLVHRVLACTLYYRVCFVSEAMVRLSNYQLAMSLGLSSSSLSSSLSSEESSLSARRVSA